MLKVLLRALTVAGFALAAIPTQAQTVHSWEYDFGTWLGGVPTYQPDSTFAHMSVSSTNALSFDFTLRAYDPNGAGNLADVFGAGAFINKVVFNSVSGANPLSISNVQTNGFIGGINMGSDNLAIGGITFDFFDCISASGGCAFQGVNGQLQSGEFVSWTLNFATPQVPFLAAPPVAVHVAGFDQNGVTGGWYTPVSQVPEPQTYGLLLAGLGLIGFVARRRQRKLAA